MLTRLTTLWSRWLTFLDEREGALPLALFRVAVALCVFLHVGGLLRTGALRAVYASAAHGGWTSSGGGSYESATTLALITLAAGCALGLGVFTRVSAFVALQAVGALIVRNPPLASGYDALLTNALWLCVIAPTGATFSFDAWRKSRELLPDVQVPSWGRRLAVLQIVVMYFIAGAQKLGAEWTPLGGFTALWFILQQPEWHRFAAEPRPGWLFFTQVGTAVTWFWEWLSPLLLVNRWARWRLDGAGRLRRALGRYDVRLPFALVGLSLHLGIVATMEVGPFSWCSLAFYVCLWREDEWRRAWARLSRR
jgi:hypothetical protein